MYSNEAFIFLKSQDKSVEFSAPLPLDNEPNHTHHKAQQQALHEEMEKLRIQQNAGWSGDGTPQNTTAKGQTNTMEVHNEKTLSDLLGMGFDEYMIKQAFKYTDGNHDDLLPWIDWMESHPMNQQETENHRVRSICTQLNQLDITCNRLQALHALDEVTKMEQEEVELDNNETNESMIRQAVQYITQYTNNGEQRYDNLSHRIKEEYMLRDQILIATIQSVAMERQRSFEWKNKKPLLMAELRSMGFLHTAITNALSVKTIKDKKSAIKWIMTHPLSEKEESNAKIQEIVNSGFSIEDAELALDKFDHNLSHSLQWLNQNKADQINHYLYHFKTERVLQVDNDGQYLLNDVNFHNEYQKWSIWRDGRIKNFHSNQILAVKCVQIHATDAHQSGEEEDSNVNETNPFLVSPSINDKENEEDNPFDVFVNDSDNDDGDMEYEICIVSELGMDPCSVYLSNWQIDEEERVIKMKILNNEKQSFLYFVCRNDRFGLDTKYHEDDMQQRWCVLSKIELTELNPKELAKELDDPDAECIICFDCEPNVILNPCGHSNFCKLCLDEYKPTQCPICRTHIKSVLHSN
eukprot:1002686_1